MDALVLEEEQRHHGTSLAADAEDDAYADLEQWYAASLPHLRSSASFAHMADAFASARQPQPTAATETVLEALDVDAFVDADNDYAIDLDGEDGEDGEPPTPSPSETVVCEAVASDPEVREIPPPDDDDDRFLSFVPKKLRSRQHPGEDVADATARARCCDKCHSDLNGKLLAKCATCAFRRHLYCFAPPLRQHPALVALSHVPRHKRLPMGTLVAQWRCDDCIARLGSAPSPEAPHRRRAKTVCVASPPTTHKLKPKTSPIKPPHDTPVPSVTGPFDWHAFRAQKYAKVIGQEEQRDEDDPVLISQQLKRELAFYAPTDALLRKTARFWQQHVHRRRQQRAQHAARLLKRELPPRRPQIRVEVSPREAAEVAESNQRRQQDEDQRERALFDDSLLYPFNDPRPVFETLRWRPPPVVQANSDNDDADGLTGEERAMREARECERMEQEDDDAPTPAQAARIARRRALAAAITKDPSLLGLYLAARIVERACVRWLGAARRRLRDALADQQQRQREHGELERMQAEEDAQRQHKRRTDGRIIRLRYQIRFLLAMVRARRRVDVKKQLVALLSDASEDRALLSSPQHQDQEQDELARLEQVKRLARRRIQRFFLRRVRRYIRLKKRVMLWRIARWWKRRHYAARFRSLAVHARLDRRDRAARRIQRAYRAFHVYKTFCALRDKHVMRRLARFLRGWLLRRLARKERDRVAVFDALCALSGDPTRVPKDAPLHAILRALGLVLFERSDFWNASALLERAVALRPDLVDRETQFALAYSHHQSWYTSSEPFQLAQAERGYRSLLQSDASDPFVLQELALVLMHREAFRPSLALLAALIERFRGGDSDGFPLWLLLAGVQLAQLGEHAQSASYLSYLVDLALPPPYLERDVLALCAISYEKTSHGDSEAAGTAKEAWRAAVRLWTLEKKVASASDGGTSPHHTHSVSTSNKHEARARLSAQRKWELLVDLAERASQTGHFLITCRALLYALERLAPILGEEESNNEPQRRAWWRLGDAFRRLGQLELFVEATARSRGAVSDEERLQWREAAEAATHRFQRELKTLSPATCVAQIRAQYETYQGDLRLEDVVDDAQEW